MNKQEDLGNEQSGELPWDASEARRVGSLKGIAEFKIEAEHKPMGIEFSEPKPKKKTRTSVQVVDIKKKNKNALF